MSLKFYFHCQILVFVDLPVYKEYVCVQRICMLDLWTNKCVLSDCLTWYVSDMWFILKKSIINEFLKICGTSSGSRCCENKTNNIFSTELPEEIFAKSWEIWIVGEEGNASNWWWCAGMEYWFFQRGSSKWAAYPCLAHTDTAPH